MKPRSILPARGRSTSAALMLEVIRPLTAADLIEAASLPAVKQGPPPLKALRAVHQKAARLIAAGRSDLEVSLAVGRGVQRIRDLKVDPTFSHLVAIYREELDTVLADEIERGAVTEIEIFELTSEEIIRRLDDEAYIQTLPLSELRQLHQMAADRSIAPPKQAQTAQQAPVEITFNIAGRGLRPPQKPESQGQGQVEGPTVTLSPEDFEEDA